MKIGKIIVQYGWGYVTTTTAQTASATVTYPIALKTSTFPMYIGCSLLGELNGSNPSNIGGLTGESGAVIHTQTSDITATNFKVTLSVDVGLTFTADYRIGYSWLCIGAWA